MSYLALYAPWLGHDGDFHKHMHPRNATASRDRDRRASSLQANADAGDEVLYAFAHSRLEAQISSALECGDVLGYAAPSGRRALKDDMHSRDARLQSIFKKVMDPRASTLAKRTEFACCLAADDGDARRRCRVDKKNIPKLDDPWNVGELKRGSANERFLRALEASDHVTARDFGSDTRVDASPEAMRQFTILRMPDLLESLRRYAFAARGCPDRGRSRPGLGRERASGDQRTSSTRGDLDER